MVFSFASTAFAAGTTYADDDQIQNGTAVAVMTGMGIIDGKGNNKFDPTAKFLRSEAAKIMTYMILTPAIAEDVREMELDEAPFPDVPVDEWYAPYVAYVAGEGLVAGWDGKFHPEDELGREEWLKMLLGIIGYDTTGLVGTGWEVKTRAMALKAGIVDSAELKLEFNRDTAVLYAWNAMNSIWVVVDKDGTHLQQTTYGKAYFGLDKTEKTADDFGRPVVVWTWKDAKPEDEITVIDTPVLVIENEAVALKDIQDKLGDKDAAVWYREDGATTATELVAAAPAIGGRGSVIEFYIPDATKPHNYRAVVVNTYAAKLGENDIVKAEGEQKAGIKLEDKTFETDDAFAKNDVVLYTKADGVVKSAAKADVKSGKVTATGTAMGEKYVRIDGDQAFRAENVVEGFVAKFAEMAYVKDAPAANFWFDTYGNLVYSDRIQNDEVLPDGVFFVIRAKGVAGGQTSGDDNFWGDTTPTAAAAKAEVIDLATGEKLDDPIDLTITKNDAGVECVGETPVADFVMAYTFAYYYKAEDGTYKLDASDATTETNVVKNGATVGSAYATNATKITTVTIKEETGKPTTYTVATATGIPAAANVEGTSVLVKADKDDNIEELYYIVEPEDAPSDDIVALYIGSGETDENGTAFNFMIDGEPKTYYSANEVAVEPGNLVALSVKDNKIDSIALVDVADYQATHGAKIAFVNGDTYLRFEGGSIVNLAKDYIAYDAEAEYAVAEVEAGDTVTYYTAQKGDNKDKIAVIVITKNKKPQ